MKEVKLTIPDNCDLVKEGNTYVIKEKPLKPKTWREFCRNNPIQSEEVFISSMSDIQNFADSLRIRDPLTDKNIFSSKIPCSYAVKAIKKGLGW